VQGILFGRSFEAEKLGEGMSKVKLMVYGCVLLLAVIAGITLFSRHPSPVGDAAELDWRQLGELDYINGKASDTLKKLDGKMVKIPGFMVPLEDSAQKVTEFLLVPSPQACIHVPPPPPNQMVLIEMEPNIDAKVEYGPIWVIGQFLIQSKKHAYGEASFTMKGMRIEPYR
jgi:hypothetical protein